MKKLLLIAVLALAAVVSLSSCLHFAAAPAKEPETLSEEAETSTGAYRITYYPDVDSDVPSEISSEAVAGIDTTICTIQELGFSKEGYVFEGWRLYRESDDAWYLRNEKGKGVWASLENGELPAGCHYALRGDGATLTAPTKEGLVRLYAQWGGKSFTVVYHPDDNSPALDRTQEITYGESTAMLTLEELGIQKENAAFKGWKLYREIDGRWRVKNAEGKGSWGRLSNSEPAEGYKFSLFSDGQTLKTATTSGIVHAYAQWSK